MATSGGDSWITEYSVAEQLYREILEKINKRDQLHRNGDGQAQLSVQIRQLLKKFNSDLLQLKQNLVRASTSFQITYQEGERRQVLLDNLERKEKQLEEAFRNRGSNSSAQRSTLFGPSFSDSPSVGWTVEETDETRQLTIDDIKLQQQKAIRDQDQGLEVLHHVLTRQKQMAYDIGNEVDLQNEIIDDITDHTDNTRERLLKETRHVKIVDRKSGTCGLWVVIILLMVAIVVVAAVPKPK